MPAVPVAVISLLICDSLPGQRLDNTGKLIEIRNNDCLAEMHSHREHANSLRTTCEKLVSVTQFEFISPFFGKQSKLLFFDRPG